MKRYAITGHSNFVPSVAVSCGRDDKRKVICTSFGTFRKSDMSWIVDSRVKIREVSKAEYLELLEKHNQEVRAIREKLGIKEVNRAV